MRSPRPVLVLIAAVLGAIFLLPAGAGGQTQYVKSYGNSMEPMFQAGDLALTRPAATYQVGDIVAYRSPQLDRIVLHRIVDRVGDEFVFQGDNNDFRDPEHLGPEHLLGRLVVRVPRGGQVFAWISNPMRAAAIAIAASVLPAVIVTRRRRRQPDTPDPERAMTMNPRRGKGVQTTVLWLAAAGTALLAIGGLGLSRPTTQRVDHAVGFTHRGSFTYTAPTTTTLFPTPATTGDTIFTRLADRVTVRFTYRVDSDAATDLTGTLRLDAILSGAGGWERTVPLLGTQRLQRADTTVEAELALPTFRALAAETAAVLGTPAGELRLAVAPTVTIAGTVAHQEVDERFEPELAFTLDDVALRLISPTGDGAGDLVQSQDGAVSAPATSPAVLSLPLPGPDPTVATARTAGLVGGASLLVLAAAIAIASRPKGDEPTRIANRYGPLLLPIAGADGAGHNAVVDLLTMDDLVRVAHHHERLVLHRVADGRHTYLIEVQGTAYRYTTATCSRANHGDRTAPQHAER